MSKITCQNCRTKTEIVSIDSRCLNCGERICTVCGCTDNAACQPNWSKPGVCSNCKLKDSILESEFLRDTGVRINAAEEIAFSVSDLYRAPFQLPLYWRNEQTGVLCAAVKNYLLHKSRGAQPPTAAEIRLIGEYLRHYIFAPCWEDVCAEEIVELRRRAEVLSSIEEIDRFIADCVEIGLDPL